MLPLAPVAPVEVVSSPDATCLRLIVPLFVVGAVAS
jgi:hypothetical protein